MWILFLFLLGCTTVSKQDCQKGEWQEMGLHDGRQGYPASRFEDLEKACAKYALPADRALYLQGRSEGLRLLCTPEQGQLFGERGGVYQNVCPPELEAEFLKHYLFGRQKYELKVREQEVQRRERALEMRESGWYRGCTFNSDCDVTGSCEDNRCSNSGRRCTFAADCTVHGTCRFGRCRRH